MLYIKMPTNNVNKHEKVKFVEWLSKFFHVARNTYRAIKDAVKMITLRCSKIQIFLEKPFHY